MVNWNIFSVDGKSFNCMCRLINRLAWLLASRFFRRKRARVVCGKVTAKLVRLSARAVDFVLGYLKAKQRDEYVFTKNSSVLGKTHAVGCRALGKSQPKIARAVDLVLGYLKA